MAEKFHLTRAETTLYLSMVALAVTNILFDVANMSYQKKDAQDQKKIVALRNEINLYKNYENVIRVPLHLSVSQAIKNGNEYAGKQVDIIGAEQEADGDASNNNAVAVVIGDPSNLNQQMEVDVKGPNNLFSDTSGTVEFVGTEVKAPQSTYGMTPFAIENAKEVIQPPL